MDPLTLALIAGGAAKAGAGIAQGVGQYRAAKALELTPEQEEELAALERTGGLTDRTRGALEARFLASQAGAQRQLEAAGLQQAAARGLAGGVSGREVFLQEMAEQQAGRQLRQEQNVLLEQARLEGQKRAEALQQQQQQAEAQKRAAIAQAVSLGLAGTGEAVSQAAAGQQQVQLAEAQAAQQTTADLLKQLQAAETTFSLMQGI